MVKWPTSTLYQGFADVAESAGDDIAVVFDKEETTYREMLADSQDFATGLANLGVSAGDTIAVWLANRPEWIKAQLAASFLGAAVVAVNTRYRTHELEYMLTDSNCAAIVLEETFLERDYLEMLKNVVPQIADSAPDDIDSSEFPNLRHVISISEKPEYDAVRTTTDVIERGRQTEQKYSPASDAEAPACIFYTSGTTGNPKGCLQTNRGLLNHSYQAGVHLGVSDTDVALGVLPFCGVFGYGALFSALLHGATVVSQPHFDAGRSVELIETHDITYLSTIELIASRIVRDDEFDAERVQSLERGAITFHTPDPDVIGELEDALGFPIVQPYGLSEANSMIFVGDPDDPFDRRIRAGGPMVSPDEEVRIADLSSGKSVQDGTKGEICIRGINVMSGYNNKPEKTAKTIDEDGWLHTGDIGLIEPDTGYVYFHSRIDDALRIRGFLVNPSEINKVIQQHPGVQSSAVVGAEHDRHGQVPVAFVTLTDDSLTVKALHDYCADQIADYKVPHHIEITDELPRIEGPHTPKVEKHKLRDRAANLIE